MKMHHGTEGIKGCNVPDYNGSYSTTGNGFEEWLCGEIRCMTLIICRNDKRQNYAFLPHQIED